MTTLSAVVMAAGEGTRMRSATPKVLHPLCGRPLVGHVLAALAETGAARSHVVVVGTAPRPSQAALAPGHPAVLVRRPAGAAGHRRRRGDRAGRLADEPGPRRRGRRARAARRHPAADGRHPGGARRAPPGDRRRGHRPHRRGSTTPRATDASSATTTAPSPASSSTATPPRPSGRSTRSTRRLLLPPRPAGRRAARPHARQRPGRVLPDRRRRGRSRQAGHRVEAVVAPTTPPRPCGVNDRAQLADAEARAARAHQRGAGCGRASRWSTPPAPTSTSRSSSRPTCACCPGVILEGRTRDRGGRARSAPTCRLVDTIVGEGAVVTLRRRARAR